MAEHTYLLQEFEALTTVPIEQLEWLEQHSKITDFAYGDLIAVVGTSGAGPHFILQGSTLLYLKNGNESREIATLEKGQIFGYLPYSRGVNLNVFAQAVSSVKLMSFDTEQIRSMIKDHFELTQALVHIMNNRVREFTALQQQNDKMAALGKLAAGLAHEINNPAAALVSDSHALRQQLRLEPEIYRELAILDLEPCKFEGVNKELSNVLSIPVQRGLTLKEKIKKEEAIANWLEDLGIPNAEELSEILTYFNFGFENLLYIKDLIPHHARATIFNWICNLLVREKIIQDIQVSSGRISELIKSVKIYTHMDRGAEKMATDIHDGLKNTISILGHKFRRSSIALIENYDLSLPLVMAYTGELNQVWTNLIDNALDSLEFGSQGSIWVTTQKDRDFVKVTITDNGPGIPESILPNIFDPFFTTKEIGKGTGMGLETVQRIVLKHKGSVKVESIPGKTTFIVCFPIG